ncbi:MAG: hypothetical protein NTV77_00625 [Candidatus Azambacteria bacterium]|nr:hypothetical protein [Candidatus Azambacteria bacterium]
MGKAKDDYESGYAQGRHDAEHPVKTVGEILRATLIPGTCVSEKSTAYQEGHKDGKSDGKEK